MPLVGFGTAGLSENTAQAVTWALEAGYRLIDSAQAREWYREDLVGDALQRTTVPRSSLFITSKCAVCMARACCSTSSRGPGSARRRTSSAEAPLPCRRSHLLQASPEAPGVQRYAQAGASESHDGLLRSAGARSSEPEQTQ